MLSVAPVSLTRLFVVCYTTLLSMRSLQKLGMFLDKADFLRVQKGTVCMNTSALIGVQTLSSLCAFPGSVLVCLGDVSGVDVWTWVNILSC